MYRTIWIFVVASFAFQFVECQQRVAPGVPPQQYQQPHGHDMNQMPHNQQQYQQPPPPQQQHQQQHQQHVQHQQHQQQQIHHQQQQIPMHQQMPVQQQVPVQHQVPVQQQQQPHGHDHGHHHGQQQVLNANVAQERGHIAEHLEVPIDTSKMSNQELQFHYFKMHDADDNNRLDGCELIKSLIHWHEQGNKDSHAPVVGDKLFKDEELVNLIDPILEMDDINRDGYIDYSEFIQAQQKAAATERSGHP